MITAERFKECVGVEPQDDDLERCNCTQVGQTGHWSCGWDSVRNMPNFVPGESKSEEEYLVIPAFPRRP